MIRRGKAEGWLTLPIGAFRPWAALNSVEFHEVDIDVQTTKGAGLIASKSVANSVEGAECLLTVPRDLILSLDRVKEHAKLDQDYRELFESLGDFVTTPRGAILSFLLLQVSVSCPGLPNTTGVHCPFTDYIKSLPCEFLPTLWTTDELRLLVGTTLAPATAFKLKSLQKEYDTLCSHAANTRWYRKVADHLDFNDWLQVDAMYRSRALDYPGIGHCMVPAIDVANHASGEATNAVYEKDRDGNAVLLLREGKDLNKGDEVTITYGDEKGACEMIFSYGFIEDGMTSAEGLFLSLVLPEDDVLGNAKNKMAKSAPGVKIIDAGDGQIDWKGDYIWLLCVGADDGLHFDLARTVDGSEEVHAFFGTHELTDGAGELYRLLGQSELWDVYRLRAVTIIQQRVFEQMQILFGSQEQVEATPHGETSGIGERQFQLALRLRELEFDLLNHAYEDLEDQKVELVKSDVVTRYLQSVNGGEDELDDDHS